PALVGHPLDRFFRGGAPTRPFATITKERITRRKSLPAGRRLFLGTPAARQSFPRRSAHQAIRNNHERKSRGDKTLKLFNIALVQTACLRRARPCRALAARTAAAHRNVRMASGEEEKRVSGWVGVERD